MSEPHAPKKGLRLLLRPATSSKRGVTTIKAAMAASLYPLESHGSWAIDAHPREIRNTPVAGVRVGRMGERRDLRLVLTPTTSTKREATPPKCNPSFTRPMRVQWELGNRCAPPRIQEHPSGRREIGRYGRKKGVAACTHACHFHQTHENAAKIESQLHWTQGSSGIDAQLRELRGAGGAYVRVSHMRQSRACVFYSRLPPPPNAGERREKVVYQPHCSHSSPMGVGE